MTPNPIRTTAYRVNARMKPKRKEPADDGLLVAEVHVPADDDDELEKGQDQQCGGVDPTELRASR